jgi:hypothetical protein
MDAKRAKRPTKGQDGEHPLWAARPGSQAQPDVASTRPAGPEGRATLGDRYTDMRPRRETRLMRAPSRWVGVIRPGLTDRCRVFSAWELITARDSIKWVTVRLIMRIAHGVAAAAAAAGLEQFSRRPGRARAGLARAARPGRGLLPGRAASPADRPFTGMACVLRAAGSPRGALRAGPTAPAGPALCAAPAAVPDTHYPAGTRSMPWKGGRRHR